MFPAMQPHDPYQVLPLLELARLDLINRQHLEALNKVMQVLSRDSRYLLAYQIAERAALELGEFQLAKQFFLLMPAGTLPPTPRKHGHNPALPPQFTLPPVVGAGNDYRHILERVELFKASRQAYTQTVSVIIPTYNRQALLANTLAALTHQTYPQHLTEIIVADDGSSDDTLAVIRKYETRLNLYYVRQEDRGYRPAAARNMGFRMAKGEAIVLLDADVLPLPHTLETYMQVLHVADNCVLLGHRRYVDTSAISDDDILLDIGVAANLPDITPDNDVAGCKDKDGRSIDWRFNIYAKTNYLKNDPWPFDKAISCNLAFSRHLQQRAGNMDEMFNAWGGEDVEYAYRLYNAGAYFIPMQDIVSLHQEPQGISPPDATASGSGESFRSKGLTLTKPLLVSKCPAPTIRRYSHGSRFEIPKVSIYIPAYNAARYIVAAVNSCLAQHYTDLEVVICNDGSTDNTLVLLEEHFAGNPQVRWVSQANGGIGKASNTAISYCRGMYIGQLDADDLLKPDAVHACVQMLDNINLDAVYTDFDIIDENGVYIRHGWCSGQASREWMATGMAATHFRMFRKRLWSRLTGCNEQIKNAVDFDLWLKISEVGEMAHIHHILYSYRWHGENTSIVHRKQQELNHIKVVTDSFVRRGLGKFWTIQPVDNPINPRELRVIPVAQPEAVTPTDVIFLIPTCAKDADKQAAVQQTWARQLGERGFKHWFLRGNPALSTPAIQDDTLYVACRDDDEYLLLKLLLGYQFLHRNLSFTHVYRIGDDCFPNLDQLVDEILPQLATKQYAGEALYPNSGQGYFLRKDVLPCLFSQVSQVIEDCGNHPCTVENVWITATLNRQGIAKTPETFYALNPSNIPLAQVKLVVVIPVGPFCELSYICDTLDSICHYMTASLAIILLDDSGKNTGRAVQEHFSEVTVLLAPRHYGKEAGLYLNLSRGLAFAYEHYDFDVLLRLDTDALIIGQRPEEDAINYLHEHPEMGIIGSYRTDCNGHARDFSWSCQQLQQELEAEMLEQHPQRRLGWTLLQEIFQKSSQNGYEPGEHCMGGAYFMSKPCVAALYQHNLLSREEIVWSRLQEDHLFGLLIYAVGFRHGDFATGSLPMGLKWRGLPCTPQELQAGEKKIIHSTRFFADMGEQKIREYFKQQRQQNHEVTGLPAPDAPDARRAVRPSRRHHPRS